MSKSTFEFLMVAVGLVAIVMTSATLFYLGTAFLMGIVLFVPLFALVGFLLGPFHREHYGADWWENHVRRVWDEQGPALWQIASLSVLLACLVLWGLNPIVYFPGEVSLPIRYFPDDAGT